MPTTESRKELRQGRTYRVEYDGVVCGEFVATCTRFVAIAAAGHTEAYISELPANYDAAVARDTYTARPPAPAVAMRPNRKGSTWEPWSWADLFEQPRGVYVVRFDGMGDALVELDPDED